MLCACGPGLLTAVEDTASAGDSDGSTEGPADAPGSDSSDVDAVPDLPEPRPDVPPEPPPTCCGCLCADLAWSCSDDTCITEAGHALDLQPEAGFLEIEAVEASVLGVDYTASAHRFWYAFAPADEAPEDKPLLVFFNGGPGAATSSGLFSMNIAPMSVDTEAARPNVVGNPDSWTAFANLLFVDARATGFSYGFGAPSDEEFSADQDAADFLRVVMRFVDRHPPLADARVAIVGESYGGQRATIMAHLVQGQDALGDGLAPTDFRDSALATELAQHAALQLVDYVSIQGLIISFDQQWAGPARPPCALGDPYACHMPAGDLEERFATSAQVLVEPASLSAALGVDAQSIAWMHAEHRGGATVIEGHAPNDAAMREAFGDLPPGQRYFTRFAFVPGQYEPWRMRDTSGRAFLELLPEARWLATNAAHDQVVYAPAFPVTLGTDYPELVEHVELQPEAFVVHTTDGEAHRVEFPDYRDSGHAVSAYEPAKLAADVRAFLDGGS